MPTSDQERPTASVLTPMEHPARPQDLCLMHDLFMHVCFQHDPDCIRLVLRVILGLRLQVLDVSLQAELRSLEGRSVVMDVLAVDDENRRYNIEVQTDPSDADPRRPRYYLSVIDSTALKKGEPFSRLPEAYSIFLVAGDPVGAGKPLYVFTRRTQDGLPLGDGTTIVYVNVLKQDLSTELGRLAHDFCCSNPDDMFFPELRAATRHFKETPEGGGRMGSMIEALEKKGEQKGEQKANRNTVARLLDQGKLTLEEIAVGVGLPIEEVRVMAKQLRGA